jgi:hypothetical protein
MVMTARLVDYLWDKFCLELEEFGVATGLFEVEGEEALQTLIVAGE